MARKARTVRNINPKPLDPLPPGTQAILRSGPDAVAYHVPTALNPPTSLQSYRQPESQTPILKTTILLPRHSTWTSGLHFHSRHTEYLRLIQGCIRVRLGNTTQTISAKAGGPVDFYGRLQGRIPDLVVRVDKGVQHEWRRADTSVPRIYICGGPLVRHPFPEDWADEVIVEEWTDPGDIEKPLFFWNLNGVILTPAQQQLPAHQRLARWILGRWWIPFLLYEIFWELDNWPVLLDLSVPWREYPSDRMVRKLEHGAQNGITFLVLFLVHIFARILGVRAVTSERTPSELWDAWQKEKGHWTIKNGTEPHDFMFAEKLEGKSDSTATTTRRSARLRGLEPKCG